MHRQSHWEGSRGRLCWQGWRSCWPRARAAHLRHVGSMKPGHLLGVKAEESGLGRLLARGDRQPQPGAGLEAELLLLRGK